MIGKSQSKEMEGQKKKQARRLTPPLFYPLFCFFGVGRNRSRCASAPFHNPPYDKHAQCLCKYFVSLIHLLLSVLFSLTYTRSVFTQHHLISHSYTKEEANSFMSLYKIGSESTGCPSKNSLSLLLFSFRLVFSKLIVHAASIQSFQTRSHTRGLSRCYRASYVVRTSIYDEKGGGLALASTRQDDEAGCMPCVGVSLRRLDAVSRDQATTLLVPPQHHHHDNGTCCILVLSSSLVSQASPCRQKDQTQASNLLLHLAGPIYIGLNCMGPLGWPPPPFFPRPRPNPIFLIRQNAMPLPPIKAPPDAFFV